MFTAGERYVYTIKYMVHINPESLVHIMNKDNDCWRTLQLDETLERLKGVVSVFYDETTVPHIMFEIDPLYDKPELWIKIENIINTYLENK